MATSFSPKLIGFFGILNILLLPSAEGYANTLGEKNDFLFKRYSGTATSVSKDGVMHLQRINPSTNEPQTKAIKQRNVVGFDGDIIEKISGERVKCILLLDHEGVTYGDCNVLAGKRKNRELIGIIDYLRSSAPELVKCGAEERRAFKDNGLKECVWERD